MLELHDSCIRISPRNASQIVLRNLRFSGSALRAALDNFTNWIIRMFHQYASFRFHRIIRGSVNENNTIFLDQSCDDELNEMLMFEQLRLGLDFILDLLHVPSNEVFFFHLVASFLLLR